MTEFNDLRREYLFGELDVKDLEKDPISQFRKWMEFAKTSNVDLPDAMVLSTSVNHLPSSRVVALRGLDDDGFVFFTNYESRKGNELDQNPNAALNFYWSKLDRQVRVEGQVEKIPSDLSDVYFQTRSRESNIAAFASKQSSVVNDRQALDDNYKILEKELGNKNMKCPEYWGGYKLIPNKIEFWQGRKNRLHDRLLYEKKRDDWVINRLAP